MKKDIIYIHIYIKVHVFITRKINRWYEAVVRGCILLISHCSTQPVSVFPVSLSSSVTFTHLAAGTHLASAAAGECDTQNNPAGVRYVPGLDGALRASACFTSLIQRIHEAAQHNSAALWHIHTAEQHLQSDHRAATNDVYRLRNKILNLENVRDIF